MDMDMDMDMRWMDMELGEMRERPGLLAVCSVWFSQSFTYPSV